MADGGKSRLRPATWAMGTRFAGASAAAVVALYLAHRWRTGPPHTRGLLKAAADLGAALSSAGSISVLVLKDLHAFLSSDSDEVPRSLRQLAKLGAAPDVQATLHTCATTLLHAAGQQQQQQEGSNKDLPPAPSAVQQVLDAALSDRGRSLVGMAVGMAARSATATLCQFLEQRMLGGDAPSGATTSSSSSSGPPAAQHVLAALTSEQGERLVSLLITKSIRAAAAAVAEHAGAAGRQQGGEGLWSALLLKQVRCGRARHGRPG